MGQIKNIKLHIVTDIKCTPYLKVFASRQVSDMSRRTARSTKPIQDTQQDLAPTVEPNVLQDPAGRNSDDLPLRRSARIAAKTTHCQTSNNQDDTSFLRTRGKNANPDRLKNSKKSADKENIPIPENDNVNLPPLESLTLMSKKDDQLVEESVMPTTPVKKFQAREGIIRTIPRTPLSGFNKRRNSASPHPHNFLRKVEDPLVQRIVSPLPTPKATEESTSAIYFNSIVEKEE